MSKNKYQFESKIHVYRATKRMTQQELADLVGVYRQTVMQISLILGRRKNDRDNKWDFQ